MSPFIESLNVVLKKPTTHSIFEVFESGGFIRFNMLYASPIALQHFRDKLAQYALVGWWFTENELVFQLADQTVVFRGVLSLVTREKIYCLELDFDPIIGNNSGLEFLQDVETFLKKCDACFFMTYSISIDGEILANPLAKSIEYLVNRK